VKGREIGDAVCYAISHPVRIGILALLNEGVRTQSEIARDLRVPQSTLQHHMVELLNSGSIDIVESRMVGNILVHSYRALRRGFFSTEDHHLLSEEQQRTVLGLTLQNAFAEHLAAFRAGKFKGDDPNLSVLWNWFQVDEEGEAELAAELQASWERLSEIEARSAARRVESKEESRSVIVSYIGHQRVRPAPGEPPFRSLVPAEE